jgi:hypothetical protein
VHKDILTLLFSLFSYIPSGIMEENSMGTLPLVIRFIKLTVFINVIFSVFCLTFGLTLAPSLLNMSCMGLWPIIFCDMVIQCYQQPDMPRGLCCLPIQVKSKWYPLILIVIFSAIFGPQLSFFAGLGVGYLHVYGYLKWMESSAQSLRAWEKRWPFKSLKNNTSYRKSSSALANSPPPG